jgi:hypothetical protein
MAVAPFHRLLAKPMSLSRAGLARRDFGEINPAIVQ